MLKSVQEVKKRFNNEIPLLDPFQDLGIQDEGFKKLVEKIKILEDKVATSDVKKDAEFTTKYSLFMEKMDISEKIKAIKDHIRSATSIMHMDELKSRKRVLRRLGYCSQSDVIEMKGRVACEISTGDELLLTELIFNGAFNDLTVDQCVTLLSCFVFEEKVSDFLHRQMKLQS
jgi:ATP-dependent RNA helicase DOB1